MYNAYFGFHETPFSVTPSPRFFYANSYYEEAYATLLYAIRERKGLVVMSGEVGTGKTTILRKLMDSLLDEPVRFVFFYNTTLTFEEMLTVMCDELGLSVKSDKRLHKIQALNAFLITQLQQGGTGVLLIDEAQNLADEVLENLRLLLNLETENEKLLQIVLVGQPELEAKLARPNLRQLKQRIALRSRLYQLKEWEVWPFIRCRLQAVGCKREDLFTPDALRLIFRYAQGTPRLINIICDNALLIAYGTGQKTVSATLIEEVAVDLCLKSEARSLTVGTTVEGDGPLRDSAPASRPAHDERVPVVAPILLTERVADAPNAPAVRAERAHWAWAIVFLAVLSVASWGVASLPFPERARLADIAKQSDSPTTGNMQRTNESAIPTAVVPVIQPQLSSLPEQSPPPVALPPASQPDLRGQPAVTAVQTPARKDPVSSALPPLAELTPRAEVVPAVRKSQPEAVKPTPPTALAKAVPVLAAVKSKPGEKEQPSPPAPPAHTSEKPKAEKPKARDPQSAQPLPAAVPTPISAAVQGKSVTVPSGFTVYALAKKVYQAPNAMLGIDLLNESNPGIGDLEHSVADKKLWVPPLDQRTLVRQQSDGSYHLILASFRSMEDAEDYARFVINARGYETAISPRQMSNSHLLYRVAIIGLSSVEQAQQVWKVFSPGSIIARAPATERKDTTDAGVLSSQEANANSSESSGGPPLDGVELPAAGDLEGISPDR